MARVRGTSRKSACAQALEEANCKWDEQQHLVSQLVASLKQATRELNSEIKKATTRLRKELERQQKEIQDAELARKKQVELETKKKLTHEKHLEAFGLNFESHSKVQVFASDAAWSAEGDQHYARPWAVESSDAVKAAFAEPE
eukprot:2258261-Pyramimonas_sp.AAC.1